MELLLNLADVLSDNGMCAVPQTPDDVLRDFFRSVRPVSTEHELIRIGGPNDGGYLVPDDLEHIGACFSPGICDNVSFEEDLATRGIKSFMADYTVEAPPIKNDLFDFERKHIGDLSNLCFIRLEDWIANKLPAEDRADLILQMDIEGYEYSVLLDTPRQVLNRFRIVVIEFHAMDRLLVASTFPFVRQAFDKLLGGFAVVHIHPNNCCPVAKYNDYGIPSVIEFTFIRRDRVQHDIPATLFPHPLDLPNVPANPDIVLPRCWWNDV